MQTLTYSPFLSSEEMLRGVSDSTVRGAYLRGDPNPDREMRLAHEQPEDFGGEGYPYLTGDESLKWWARYTACETSCECSCEHGCRQGCECECETTCETNCEGICETGCIASCEVSMIFVTVNSQWWKLDKLVPSGNSIVTVVRGELQKIGRVLASVTEGVSRV